MPARTHTRRDPRPAHDSDSDNLSLERRTLPALTPNFAPASHLDHRRTAPALPRTALTRSHTLRRTDTPDTPASPRDLDVVVDHADNADHAVVYYPATVTFPPLRRMGRRTIADGPLPASSLRESWSPATTLDGLGDRERSMSPVVEDQWETMLTSVAPDPLAPTAESSFASAAASASFSQPSSRAGSSNSNSASSSRTHLTVPSRRQSWSHDNFLRACDTSDDDSASDTEAEDDAPALVPTAVSDEPPPRNPRYSRAIRERSHESASFVRSFYGEVPFQHTRRLEEQTAADDRATSDEETPLVDQELRDARILLERLSRREDISDDFWASVGLRRPVADRVERIQQRERP